ncbi:MAG: hypothetical protein AB8G05_24465 [Oligoflexales bacterium]
MKKLQKVKLFPHFLFSPRIMEKILCAFAAAFLIFLSIPRLFYPSMHMDESLYIGATQRILNGDLFLSKFWFDKFFATPIMLALGILIGGENQVGFRLAALVCSVYTIYVILTMIVEMGENIITSLAMFLFALGILLSPFMIFYHVSSFTDPFLLLFLVLFARSLYRAIKHSGDQSRNHLTTSYHYFAIASLFKLSSLMWSPMLVGFWYLKGGIAGIKNGIKDFFYTTKWWMIVGTCYTLANPEKLAPLLWFKALGKRTDSTLWQKGILWVGKIGDIFQNYYFAICFFLILSFFLFFTYIQYRKSGKNYQLSVVLFLFNFPFILHVVGLWLSGAGIFERYLYILIPQGIFVIAISSLKSVPGGKLKTITHIGLGCIGLLMILDSGISNKDFVNRLPPPSFGRHLYQIRDETLTNAIVHNNKLLWYLYPFDRLGTTLNACDRSECFEEARLGRTPFAPQYWLRTNSSLETNIIRPSPQCKNSTCRSKKHTLNLTDTLTIEKFKESLRISGWADSISMNLENSQSEQDTLDRYWMTSPSIKNSLKITTKVFPLIGKKDIFINGRIVLLNNPLSKARFGVGRWVLAFRIEEVRITKIKQNFVDIIPLLFKGYTIPISPINLPASDSIHEMIISLKLQRKDTNDSLDIEFISLKNRYLSSTNKKWDSRIRVCPSTYEISSGLANSRLIKFNYQI